MPWILIKKKCLRLINSSRGQTEFRTNLIISFSLCSEKTRITSAPPVLTIPFVHHWGKGRENTDPLSIIGIDDGDIYEQNALTRACLHTHDMRAGESLRVVAPLTVCVCACVCFCFKPYYYYYSCNKQPFFSYLFLVQFCC